MRARARLRRAAAGAETRGLALLSAVHSGLWLGLLDPDDLRDLDEAYYARVPRYLSAEHNLSGLMPWEQEAVETTFPASGRVLVLAAGAGREVLALASAGYDVQGYEPHPDLVDLGRGFLQGRGTLERIGRDRAPAGGGPHDAAVVGWGGYMLVSGRERRVALLRELRQLVVPGAPLLISFFSRPEDDRRSRLVSGVAGTVRRLRGRPGIELGDDLRATHVHRFTRAEVAGELADGGFRLVRHEDQGPGPTDSGWAVGVAEPR